MRGCKVPGRVLAGLLQCSSMVEQNAVVQGEDDLAKRYLWLWIFFFESYFRLFTQRMNAAHLVFYIAIRVLCPAADITSLSKIPYTEPNIH